MGEKVTKIDLSLYKELLESIRIPLYVIRQKDYEMLFINSYGKKYWGKYDDYQGKKCYHFMVEQDAPCDFCDFLSEEVSHIKMEEFYLDDKKAWMQGNIHKIIWDNEDAVLFYYFDVTEFKMKKIYDYLDLDTLDVLVQNVPSGMAIGYVENHIIKKLSINDIIEEYLGIPKGILYMNDHSLISTRIHKNDIPNVRKSMLGLKENHRIHSVKFRYSKNNNGCYIWYRIDVSCIDILNGYFLFISMHDIDDEKKKEEELWLANHTLEDTLKIYSAIAAKNESIVYEFDLKSRTLKAIDNEYARKRFKELGYPMVLKNVPEVFEGILDKKNYDLIKKIYAEFESGEKNNSVLIEAKEKDGKKRIAKLDYTCIYNSEGKPVKYYGTVQNITEKWEKNIEYKEKLEAFNNYDEKYLLAKVHVNLSDNYIISSADGQHKSLALVGADGKNYSEILDEVSQKALQKEDVDKIKEMYPDKLIKLYEKGKTNYEFYYRRGCRVKFYLWMKLDIQIFENPYKNNLEAFVYIYDSTKYSLSRMLISKITEIGFELIGIIDTVSGLISTYENDEGMENFVEKTAHLDYDSFFESEVGTSLYLENGERIKKYFKLENVVKEIEEKSTVSFRFNFRDADGNLKYKSIELCFLDDSKRYIYFCEYDITKQYLEEKEQYRKMEEAAKIAKMANDSKTEFISRISHDIRTPISIIKNMVDFAMEDIYEPEKLKSDLRKIEAANGFLLSLINDVLDISKIDSGKMELNEAPYTAKEHIENVESILKTMCDEKHLKYEIKDYTGQGVIVVDKIRINQIILNLISNAVKYTPSGGTVKYTSLTKQLKEEGKMLFGFEIEDNGIGMSKEFQKKLFEPFTQEYNNPFRKKTSSGTGLGMSIVKKIIDLMDGEIEVYSKLGRGTKIRVSVVTDDASDNLKYRDYFVKKMVKDDKAQIEGKILLVEDNEINMEIVKRIMDSYNIEYDSAINGKEAVDIFEKSSIGEFSAILMDIQLPIMNGYEATKAIRSLPRTDAEEVVVIAMTADAFSDAIKKGKESGMDEYVIKPLNPKILYNTLVKRIGAKNG
ncbi:His Kinase A (phospho-acceptor) domain-containing protein [Acetitomaculum ruminis DSM 5522]|uniref:Stage 0 sporulation protein A homolog n=1 Tax=Acetitomaculum ruminis DSM 5522 TaxID=1120918 RepID=A0A1I0XR15_9FIRM|nr:PAS domain-containing sensor histidine kinase [Acetitomaculum ruminis]SFB02383.1 His Kinase A (phospho-acceptor) domain-containing protein [Acetitomaculum ruminis DSM 5522]